MKVSYNWLQELIIGKLPPPVKLARLLTMHSFEVESVERVGKDFILDIAVLPNRAHDCLSHIGVAKELSALLKFKIQNSKFKIKEDKKLKTGDFIDVKIKDSKKCPFYAARVILNIKVAPSPKWLRERLEVLGQKSINNVVDAANYVMLEMGQPLHVFDFFKIKNMEVKSQKSKVKSIIIRRAKNGEEIDILGGGKYELSEDDLVIADADSTLAIAGVKGGTKAEVTSETKNIVLEAAYFEPSGVRATSKRLGLRTDVSLRFENGIVPTLPEKALDRAANFIADLSGGEITKGVARAGRVKYLSARVVFAPEQINKLLGVEISEREMTTILKHLGFFIEKKKKMWVVTAPKERLDIGGFQDLAEEVGRIYGFENIPSVLPESALIPSPRNDELAISEKIRTALSGIGFCETYNRSFVSEKQLDLFHFDKKRAVAVANPLSAEHKFLRPSLLFHLLNNAAENLKHQKIICFFEIGNIFQLEGKNGVLEQTMLAGIAVEKGEKAKKAGREFYEFKGITDALLEKLGLDEFWYSERGAEPEGGKYLWRTGRAAEVKIGNPRVLRAEPRLGKSRHTATAPFAGLAGCLAGLRFVRQSQSSWTKREQSSYDDNRVIGAVGEISPGILRALGVSEQAAAFEFYLRDLIELAEEKTIYTPIGKYPAVERDIAVLVPAQVKVDAVQSAIEIAAGELLADNDLFDIYEGEHLEAERKSLAFHLIFQSSDRTLTDSEVNGIFNKIVKAIESEGWEVRG